MRADYTARMYGQNSLAKCWVVACTRNKEDISPTELEINNVPRPYCYTDAAPLELTHSLGHFNLKSCCVLFLGLGKHARFFPPIKKVY